MAEPLKSAYGLAEPKGEEAPSQALTDPETDAMIRVRSRIGCKGGGTSGGPPVHQPRCPSAPAGSNEPRDSLAAVLERVASQVGRFSPESLRTAAQAGQLPV